MTAPSAPDDPTTAADQLPAGQRLDALLLAYVDGTLDAPLRAELEVRLAGDPDLRAEVDGLQALRGLLDEDARYGRESLLDVPPAHLLEAIVRAEVLARPDEIRQAIVNGGGLARTAPERGDKPLWARLQSWWMGGGVVVGAAAAVAFVITRGPAEPPRSPTPAAAVVAPATTSPNALNDALADAPAGERQAEGAGAAVDEFAADGAPSAKRMKTSNAGPNAVPDEPNGGLAELDKRSGGGRAANLPTLQDDPQGDLQAPGGNAVGDSGADRGFASASASAERAERAERKAPVMPTLDAVAAEEPAPRAPPAPKSAESRKPADNARDDDASSYGSAPAPVTTSTTPSAAPPPPPATPPTSVGGGSLGYQSADQSRDVFLEKMRAKKTAQIEREEASKKKPSSKSSIGGEKSKDAPAAPAKGKADRADKEMTATESREELEREKRINAASMMLTAAERELAAGRAQDALDLAVRAEAQGGGALGLVPASTQTRAYLLLKRFADGARVGSRLLQGDVSDVVIVDGLLAGADAATAIGDRRLAERLLVKVLAPPNKDVARRAAAQRRLDSLRAASVRNRAAESDAAMDAPAASSKSSAPSTSDE